MKRCVVSVCPCEHVDELEVHRELIGRRGRAPDDHVVLARGLPVRQHYILRARRLEVIALRAMMRKRPLLVRSAMHDARRHRAHRRPAPHG